MLSATVAALACLCLARTSPAEPHTLRAYTVNSYVNKDIANILASIDERLRVIETVSTVQAKQARRLDVIQNKLDRIETTLSLKLERAQLVAEKLEHRLHKLETTVQTTIKESSHHIEKSQTKIAEIAQNLTSHLSTHTHLLEKVSGSYTDTWRRGLLLESMVRDGMTLINVTRRELADGLRALARRQRDARLTPADLEVAFSKRIHENNFKIDLKMQEVLDAQKRFIDSCQRVQLDDPTHVADVLGKLIDSLINKTASTFHELQKIQLTMRNHDTKVIKLLNTRPAQNDVTCKRIENMFRNTTPSTSSGKELQQLTEKFIDLTNRADSVLQKLESRVSDDGNGPAEPSEVTAAADRLLNKLNGIRSEKSSEEDDFWDEDLEATGLDSMNDLIEEEEYKSMMRERNKITTTESAPTRPHRRHLHKHPYDRGPTWKEYTGK
ncbi:uncharacterized protein LOC121730956 [Aricia agestis]|uniref:uncharacterized protein LOC121730956 n=1 Tax=Aricia agestis TaxID=91739 RepID=UPI001C20C04E|nr:uncharacterized protein LOC121730956 [Aricia agestis]